MIGKRRRARSDAPYQSLFSPDQRVHHARFGQRGNVADLVGLVLGDLPEDAAHDFSAARLRQAGRKLDFVRHGNRADFLADMRGEFLFQFFAFGDAVLQRHERVERLALDVVRHGRDGGFGHFRMAHERALHFRRADAMAGDVHHVVHAAEQPVIAVGIHAAAVAGEIHVLERGKIGVDETVMVAPRRAHDARPRLLDAELAAFVRLAFAAVVAQHHRLDAEERRGWRCRV